MTANVFQREYLVRQPLPLAQLYGRSYNAKDARSRHDNAFYLFEAWIKLAAAPMVACYLREAGESGQRVAALDQALAHLALPSLGHWISILREAARRFGQRPDASSHPLGHVWEQLSLKHQDRPALLALYRRIKNGPDGEPGGDAGCSLLEVLEALVQYRNGVFGHGAGRFGSFYEAEMGPLLFPAVNELLEEGFCQPLGPPGTRLVYLTEVRTLDERYREVSLIELTGRESERLAPLQFSAEDAADLVPNCVAALWPGRRSPLRLDPLLQFRGGELAEEMLFLNRDRNGRQVEYLSYTTGRTERDRTMVPQLARLLSRVVDREVTEEELAQFTQQSLAETPSVEQWFPGEESRGQRLGDYEVLAEIGRGGMGVVYLARQLSLGRLVALKMLPADLAGDEVALSRFRREMRALGRCEHSAIVKVLASGTMPDGQLYYAMEYMSGADLERVWRELSGTNREGEASALGSTTWGRAILSASRKQRRQSIRRPRSGSLGAASEPSQPDAQPKSATEGALTPAETAAEALAASLLPPLPEAPGGEDVAGGYARRVAAMIRDVALALQTVHDQGIIHRDVKPANLMLTPDGSRVVLMDFGLAKGKSLSLTASGQGGFLGTLRYAAPEQLAAATLPVGPAADVRALGVTMWELLTRQRLFGEAEDEAQLAQLVHDHDVPRLRAVDPSLDADLEAIVARATERRPTDRIQTAREMADYLQMYLDGKTLPIRPPSSGELMQRWIRDHRPLVAASAAAAAVIAATIVVAFLLILNSRNNAHTLALEKTNLAIKETAARHEAEQNDQLAQENSRLIESQVNAFLVQQSQDRRLTDHGLERLRADILDLAKTHYDRLAGETGTNSAVASGQASSYWNLAAIKTSLGESTEAINLYRQAQAIYERLVKEDGKDGPSHRSDLASIRTNLGSQYREMGRYGDAEAEHVAALSTREQLVAEFPGNAEYRDKVAGSRGYLGDLYHWNMSQYKKAQTEYREAVQIREKLVAESPSHDTFLFNLATAYQDLASLMKTIGRHQEAEEAYLKAQTIRQRQALDFPDSPSYQSALAGTCSAIGDLYVATNRRQLARESYQQSLKMRKRLAESHPDDVNMRYSYVIALKDWGNFLSATGESADAEATYSEAIAIIERLVNQNPRAISYRQQLANLKIDQAKRERTLGLWQQAERDFLAALTIRKEIAERNPEVPDNLSNLAWIQSELAFFYSDFGRFTDAEREARAALEVRQKLVAEYRTDVSYRQDLGTAWRLLGYIHRSMGNLATAREELQQGRAILEQLVEENSTVAGFASGLAEICMKLGEAEQALGLYSESLASYERSSEVRQTLADKNPDVTEYRKDLAFALAGMVYPYRDLGRFQEAEDVLRRGMLLATKLVTESPDVLNHQYLLADLNNSQGNLCTSLKRYDEAEKCLLESVRICGQIVTKNPTVTYFRSALGQYHHNLGILYEKSDRTDDAVSAYQKAVDERRILVEQVPTSALYRVNLGWSLHGLANSYEKQDGGFAKAEKAYLQAIEIREKLVHDDPKGVSEATNLGFSYQQLGRLYSDQGDLVQSAQTHRRSIAIREKIVATVPDDLKALNNLGYSWGQLGWVLSNTEPLQESVVAYRESAKIRQQLLNREPDNPEYLENVGWSYRGLGKALAKQEEWDESVVAYRGVIAAHIQALKTSFRSDYLRQAAWAFTAAANVLEQGKRVEEALAILEEAIAFFRDVSARNKGEGDYQLRNAIWQRGEILLRSKEYARALNEYSRAIQEYEEGSFNHNLCRMKLAEASARTGDHKAARDIVESILKEQFDYHLYGLEGGIALTQASEAAKRDLVLSEEQRASLANDYAARAVVILKAALEADHFQNLSTLKSSSDLEPLRSRADYANVIADAEKAAQERATKDQPTTEQK
jgi:serine/threonine protein kinase/predicted negative regulator of RcsB-dependent stress response